MDALDLRHSGCKKKRALGVFAQRLEGVCDDITIEAEKIIYWRYWKICMLDYPKEGSTVHIRVQRVDAAVLQAVAQPILSYPSVTSALTGFAPLKPSR